MTWTIRLTKKADKSFAKLDKQAQQRVMKKITSISMLQNPRQSGKALTGLLTGLWRYRTGDYRLICDIRDEELYILVIDLGHRKNIYD